MQNYTSAKTSRNQIPALIAAAPLSCGTVNVDIGGGKYNKATEFLAGRGVENVVYDPYNRTQDHNRAVINRLGLCPADTATVANVLNVINNSEIRSLVIWMAYCLVKNGGAIYFSVYEGDRSGVGRATRDGWQENRPLASYLPEIQAVFPSARIWRKFIIAENKIGEN